MLPPACLAQFVRYKLLNGLCLCSNVQAELAQRLASLADGASDQVTTHGMLAGSQYTDNTIL